MVAIDNTIDGVAIPKISTVFHALDDVGWYGSAYLLTVTALQPTFGNVYRYFDGKITYVVSVVVLRVSAKPHVNQTIYRLRQGRLYTLRSGTELSDFHPRPGHCRYPLSWNLPRRSRHHWIHCTPEQKASIFGDRRQRFWHCYMLCPHCWRCFHQSSDLDMVFLDACASNLHLTVQADFSHRNLPIGGVVFFTLLATLKIKGTDAKSRALPFKTKMRNIDIVGATSLVGAVCCLLLALQ